MMFGRKQMKLFQFLKGQKPPQTSKEPKSPKEMKGSKDISSQSPLPSPSSSPSTSTLSSPPSKMQPPLLKDKVVAKKSPLHSSPSPSAEVSLPSPPSRPAKMTMDMDTDIRLPPPPPGPSPEVLSPPRPLNLSTLSTDMGVDIRSLAPASAPPPAATTTPPLLQPNAVSGGGPAIPPPLILQPNVEAAQSALVATEPQLSSPLPLLTNIIAVGIPLPLPRSSPPPASLKPNVATGTPLLPPPSVPLQPKVVATRAPLLPPPSVPLQPKVVETRAPLQPPPSVPLQPKVVETRAPLPPLPPPPPPTGTTSPMMLAKGPGPLPPPPPPPPPTGTTSPMMLVKGPGPGPLPPPPPPPPPTGTTSPMMLVKGPGPLPPPVSATDEGGTPPLLPPPKKTNTKLKISSQMGNLYRVLRSKVEGYSMQSKSSTGKSADGKQGLPDALSEMTKRSAHFQQIEEDVEKYAKSIIELKTNISTFSTKDMTKLIKFHKHVESILDNLTDETQVLARFEGFPTEKLEALRTASGLYSKFESMITVLQNLKIEPPLHELLDKVDRHFTKIKGEIDALELTKDEESKKFMSHNIEFDFQILVRIKEAMVDVSSKCMELTMKERREVKLRVNEESKTKVEAQKKGRLKMLWRAFQSAFRVYTFSGEHDDRADKLSLELPQHQ